MIVKLVGGGADVCNWKLLTPKMHNCLYSAEHAWPANVPEFLPTPTVVESSLGIARIEVAQNLNDFGAHLHILTGL